MSCITCTEVFPTFRDLKDHCLATRHAYFSYKCGSCDELYSTLEGLDEHMSLHYSPITDDPVASEVEVDFATVDDGPLFADSDHSDANGPSVIGTLEEDDNEASSDWERLSGSGVSSYVTTGSITPPLSSTPSEISIPSTPSGLEDVVEGWDNLSSGLTSARATSPSPPTQDPLLVSPAIDNSQPNPAPSLGLPAYFQEIMQKYFVWSCSLCNRLFPTERILNEHRQQKHLAVAAINRPAEYDRPDVGRLIAVDGGFFDANLAAKSLDAAQTNAHLPNSCPICGKRFQNSRALIAHVNSSPKAHCFFKCSSCRNVYTSITLLNQHRAKHGAFSHQPAGTIPSWIAASLPAQRKPPVPAPVPQSLQPPFKCRLCGKTMTNMQALRDHEASRADAHKPFKCSSCSKAYWAQKDLDDHRLLKHSGPVEVVQSKPSYQCSVCGKEFNKKKKLKAHLVSEANSHSTWKCSICDRVFVTRELLKKHQLKKHKDSSSTISGNSSDNTAERTFTCLLCPSSFHSPSAVAQHLESGCHAKFTRHHITAAVKSMGIVPQITVHQITGPVAPPKQVVVPKATTSSWNGTQFQCFMCSRGFKSLVQLNNHLRSPVHDQKEFKCPKCKTKFALISGLVQHLESRACGLSNADEIINFYDRLSTGFSNRLLIA